MAATTPMPTSPVMAPASPVMAPTSPVSSPPQAVTPKTELAEMAPHEPSLVIPHVYSNISWKRIKQVIEEEAGLGEVDRIDLVKSKKQNSKGQDYKKAFIHFKRWNDTDVSDKVRTKVASGGFVKIHYEEGKPWFWKVFQSTEDKPEFEKKAPKPKAASVKAKGKHTATASAAPSGDIAEALAALSLENAKLRTENARLNAQVTTLLSKFSA